MRLGVRFGPVWVSSGGRRRRGGPSGFKVLAGAVCVAAVADALASGGWWVVLGWTVVGVTVLTLVVRLFKRTPGAQHHGGEGR